MPAPLAPFDRLSKYVVPTGVCWEWTGALDRHGYGVTRENYVLWRAHRWVWTFLVGPIEDALDLDHLCRNRKCVNPDHLEPVTRKENLLRGSRSLGVGLRATCRNGHDITAPGSLVQRSGRKRCVNCERERGRRAREAKRVRDAEDSS